jgi:hypothetical protein
MGALNQNDLFHVTTSCEFLLSKIVLEKFDRASILESYFNRIGERLPEFIPAELEALYNVDLYHIKIFLLNQKPYDQLLHKIFGMMS